MKIKIDDNYQIVSDSLQYILQEKKVANEGQNKGKAYWTNISYHGKIHHALQKYKDIKIRNSNVETIDELLTCIKELDKKIEKLLGGN